MSWLLTPSRPFSSIFRTRATDSLAPRLVVHDGQPVTNRLDPASDMVCLGDYHGDEGRSRVERETLVVSDQRDYDGSIEKLNLNDSGDIMTTKIEPWKSTVSAIENPARPQRSDEKVVALSSPPAQSAKTIGDYAPAAESREWSGAVSMVLEAADAIRKSEQRVRDVESQCASISNEATQEIQRLGQALLAAETRVAAAEERALEANRRATEAEDSLKKLYSSITETLSPLLTSMPRASNL